MRRTGVTDPILLIGAGRMGGAMLRGWLARGLGPVIAVDPQPAAFLRGLKGVRLVKQIESVCEVSARACVVALKPQALKTEGGRLAPLAARKIPMISIAAGASIATLRKAWGREARIMRAMPNTPGAIGKGVSSLYAPPNVPTRDRRLAEILLEPLGAVIRVGRERLIDVTTAVSGSGPAYVFLLAEALAEAAQIEGMPRREAELLARATVMGAGALLSADGRPPSDLRRDVTSPGGTTEAALKILLGPGGLKPLMARAVAAANRRARELSS
jgi:pyrroline-5-carboxylate reductase